MKSEKTPSTVSYDELLDCLLDRLKQGEVTEGGAYIAELLLSLERKIITDRLKRNEAGPPFEPE